jgi:hypothetical protein
VVAAAPVVRPGASAQQLAHTGSSAELALGFGAVTLALGAVACSIAMRARRRTGQD